MPAALVKRAAVELVNAVPVRPVRCRVMQLLYIVRAAGVISRADPVITKMRRARAVKRIPILPVVPTEPIVWLPA